MTCRLISRTHSGPPATDVLLLDTHVLLWWLDDQSLLAAEARERIADPRRPVFVSAAAAWEITIKRRLGKLEAPDDLEEALEQERFQHLPIAVRHALAVADLPGGLGERRRMSRPCRRVSLACRPDYSGSARRSALTTAAALPAASSRKTSNRFSPAPPPARSDRLRTAMNGTPFA